MGDLTSNTKRCSNCRVHKPFDEYYVCKQRKDNMMAKCKDCFKNAYHKNKRRKMNKSKEFDPIHLPWMNGHDEIYF